MKLEQDTKQITCPDHPQGKHKAILYCWPHKFAGIWECKKTGASETHDHYESDGAEVEVEDAVQDYHDPGNQYGHGQREYRVYVCGGTNGCGVQLEGDPDADAAEDAADMAYDEMRDNEL